MRWLVRLFLLVSIVSPLAYAGALTTVPVFNAANPDSNRVAATAKLAVLGAGTTSFYYLEADPATGALPVTFGAGATVGLTEDHNYGVVGANTLRTGAQLGNATGPILYGTGASSAQVPRVVVSTDSTISAQNFPTTVNTNFGVPGASTVRTAAELGVGGAAVSNANPVPISDAGGIITVDGTVTANQGGAPWTASIVQGGNTAAVSAASALKVDNSAVTQPVSGTVTANQGGAPWTVTGTGTAGTAATGVLTVQGIASMTPLLVNGSGVTQPVSGTVSASNFPATVDVSYGTPTASTVRTAAMMGIGLAAVSAANPVPTSQAGRTYADSARNDYSSVNVTTATWVQLIASTTTAINELFIDDTCGQVLELGTGAAASETRKLIIPRGGFTAAVDLAIPAATRVSLRAITANCTVGDITLTGLQ